jgi:hypothetical protein
MKFKKNQSIKMVKKKPLIMVNKHENLEDHSRKHEYFLKISQNREYDYPNIY